MLSQSNMPVVEALRSFKPAGVSVAFLVPTLTGLDKSIMDATQPLRSYLREKQIHDFSTQRQGTEDSCQPVLAGLQQDALPCRNEERIAF